MLFKLFLQLFMPFIHSFFVCVFVYLFCFCLFIYHSLFICLESEINERSLLAFDSDSLLCRGADVLPGFLLNTWFFMEVGIAARVRNMIPSTNPR